ncbi:MAG: IS3 family transposase [Sumerlaeia bacterium]
MTLALEARQQGLPTRAVCRALVLAPATIYRKIKALNAPPSFPTAPAAVEQKTSPSPHPRALSPGERAAIMTELHSDRFCDMAPAAVCATLLDEGRYLCSPRTMYRILNDHKEVRERRSQASHPKRAAPELAATAPNQVWTWDITHLPGPAKGSSYKLYVCLDLFSRFAVGWYLSLSESAAEARDFFAALAKREKVDTRRLILHADNGGPMRSRPLADLLESLGIARSHSRPRTSNDNPFIESQFKTMKYRPHYPGRFASQDESHQWCREFFEWYNFRHRHEGLVLLTPADVHHGQAAGKIARRGAVLGEAYLQHPERFVNGPPKAREPAAIVTINKAARDPAPTSAKGLAQEQEVAN